MEAYEPATYRRWLIALGVGVVLLVGSLALIANDAAAKDVASSEGSVTRGASLELGELGFDSVTTRSANEVSVRRKAKKPRVWPMPVAVAQRATRSFAQYIYSNTTPNDFDEQGLIIGDSDWDY